MAITIAKAGTNYVGLSTDTKPTTNVSANSTFEETDTGDLYDFDGDSWNKTRTSGVDYVEPTQLANERNVGTANQYGVGVDECNYASVAADTNISTSAPALLFGVLVTAATATNVIEIRDATAAAGGTVVLSIPASTAIGTFYDLKGAKLNTGIFADFTGTGTIVVLWRPQS